MSLPLPSFLWKEFRVQEGITESCGPKFSDGLQEVSPELAHWLFFLRLKPQWSTQEFKMLWKCGREQIGGRGQRSKTIKEMNKSFAFFSSHLIHCRKNLSLFVYLMKHKFNTSMFPKKNEDILFCQLLFILCCWKTKFKAAFVCCKNEGGQEKKQRDLNCFLLRQLWALIFSKLGKNPTIQESHAPPTHTHTLLRR